MKKIVCVLVILVAMFSYGKVLQYNTAFENLAPGDTVDVDLHLHYPLDSIKNVVNGNLTGSNISDTAKFNQRVIDSVKYTNADWMFNYTRRWQKWNPGTFNGRFGRGVYFYLNDTTANDEDFRLYFDSTKLKFLVNDDSTWTSKFIADTVRATYGDFTLQDTLKSNVIKSDSLTYIGNDTARFVVTKAGYVGIGIVAPGANLHIVSSTAAAESRLEATAGDAAAFYLAQAGGVGSTGIRLQANAMSGALITTNTNPMVFQINYNEKMRITTDGYVGIDTTAPASKLHVAGSVRVRDTIHANIMSAVNTGKIKINRPGAPIAIEDNDIDYAGVGYVRIDTQGSVALDTVHTITSAASGDDGTLLYVHTAISTRDVLFIQTSNLRLAADRLLNDRADILVLMYNGDDATWNEVSFSDNN